MSEKKGGRKKASSAQPEVVEQLKVIAKDHTAGSTVEPQRVWTSQSAQYFADELAELGFSVCANTVKRLLREELGLSRRKMVKTLTMGHNADRNAQFERMAKLKKYFLSRHWPVLSIDTKKKELLGRFERPGQAWTDTQMRAWDHDFPSSSWGKVIPYGVYDLAHNEALVTWRKEPTRASWRVTRFVAGGTAWANGNSIVIVRFSYLPIAEEATAIACRFFASNSTNFVCGWGEPFEFATSLHIVRSTIRSITASSATCRDH